MKKTLILSVIVALSAVVSAQTDTVRYQSVFGDSSATWYIFQYVGEELYGGTEAWQVLSIDTITIEGQTYKNCRMIDGRYSMSHLYDGAPQYLREDETHSKLFLRLYDHFTSYISQELLIMDLNLNVGDTLETTGWDYLLPSFNDLGPVPKITIDSIYYSDGRKILRTNHYVSTYGFKDTLFFIEGVGPSFGPLYVRQHYVFFITCFDKDDSIIYHDNNYYIFRARTGGPAECILHWFVSIPNTQTTDTQLALSPNPTSGTVTVRSAEQMTEVEVVDIVGASVLRQQASGLEARLDVKALPRGSYMVRIHTPMGVTSRKLILQ